MARNSQGSGDILNRIAVGYFDMLAAAVIRFVLIPKILPTMKNRRIFRNRNDENIELSVVVDIHKGTNHSLNVG